MQVQQVEEVDALLLYVVVLAQFVVDPLKAGRVARYYIVVINVACLGDDAEKGAQLRSPGGQVCCCVLALRAGNSVGIGVIGQPGAVGAAPHERGEAVIL